MTVGTQPKPCVVVPTFNNIVTLPGVLQRIRAHAQVPIIVVNDGSTDGTTEFLNGLPDAHVIQLDRNRGKGYALRTAFNEARRLGHTHAITIDSDGQHDPADLPAMIRAINERPEAMIMGARDMGQHDVPGRSSFGNRFSNFWFLVETGIRLPDTQTGYRAWPLIPLGTFRTISDRFGFEVEAIVKLAWRGTPFTVVPVSIRYDFPERVSHFKPVRDFARISVLNTWLVALALLWYWPKRMLFQGGLMELLRSEFVRPEESPARKACSIGFGLFMGIVPIWGFQLAIGIPLAVLLKLNRVLFITAANISIPPMIPLIIFTSHLAGAPFMGDRAVRPVFSTDLSLQQVTDHLAQYIVGSVALAICAGIIGTVVAFPILYALRHRAERT